VIRYLIANSLNREAAAIFGVDIMNIQDVKDEIESLGKTPAAEKMYPITSNWVPVTDVLAIINRFEKHWRNQKGLKEPEGRLIADILGK